MQFLRALVLANLCFLILHQSARFSLMKLKSFEFGNATPVRRMTILLATGFGLGLAPVASGTVGTLLGVVMVVGCPLLPVIVQAVFAFLLIVLCIPICDVAEQHFGGKDDGRIVADEYMTFPLCVVGLPFHEYWWLLAVAFVTHRLLDIIKPFPAYRLQALGGGKGIVVDDVISSLYALILNHGLLFAYLRFLG